jgi:hypothetical protein
MNDKLQQLYDLYKQKGIISTTDFNTFASASDNQRQKLYDLGVQKGLFNTTDYNTFNTAWGGSKQEPVKKKDFTASDSKLEKPTSVSSSKKVKRDYDGQVLPGQQKFDASKYQKVGDKYYDGQGEIFTNYPGKEGKPYRYNNGQWFEYSSTKRIDNPYAPSVDQLKQQIKDPMRIAALNKQYGKQAGTEKGVYVGYPGKEQNEYKVENGQWKKRTPDNKTWITVTNEGSINALNNQFKQKAETIKDPQKISSIKQDNEYSLAFNRNLKSINSSLIDKETTPVMLSLSKMFPVENGWRFDSEGPSDRVRITAPNGQKETFVLDNWTWDEDNKQAAEMRGWMQRNNLTPSEYKRQKEVKTKLAEERRFTGPTSLGDREAMEAQKVMMDKNLADALNISKPLDTEQQRLLKKVETAKAEAVPARLEFLTEKSRKAAEIQNKYQQYLLDPTGLTESQKREAQMAIGALADDKSVIYQSNKFVDDIKNNAESYKNKYRNSEYQIGELNNSLVNGDITQDEYKAKVDVITKELSSQESEIKNQIKLSDKIASQSNQAVGENAIIREAQGSFGGAFTLGLIKGAASPIRLLSGAVGEGMTASEWHDAVREAVSPFWNYDTSLEYIRSEERPDLYKAAFSVSESLGTAAVGGAFGLSTAFGTGLLARGAAGALTFFPMSFYEMKDELAGVDMPESHKIAISSIYGVVSGALESLGMEYAMGKLNPTIGAALKRNILKNVLSRSIPKNAPKEFFDALIRTETKAYLGSLGLGTIGAGAVEGVTEGLQSLTGAGIKEIYDQVGDKTELFSNEGIGQIVKGALYETYLGALGGGMVHSTYIASDAIRRKAALNSKELEMLLLAAKSNGMSETLMTNLKADMLNGRMTRQEAKEISQNFDMVRGNVAQMPDNLTPEAQSVSLGLMMERDRLNQQIEGKDPNLVKPQSERVAEINNRLQEIAKENAVQEQSTGEVPVQPTTGVSTEVEERVPGTETEVVTGETITEETEGQQAETAVAQEERQSLIDAYVQEQTELINNYDEEYFSTEEKQKLIDKLVSDPVAFAEQEKRTDGEFGFTDTNAQKFLASLEEQDAREALPVAQPTERIEFTQDNLPVELQNVEPVDTKTTRRGMSIPRRILGTVGIGKGETVLTYTGQQLIDAGLRKAPKAVQPTVQPVAETATTVTPQVTPQAAPIAIEPKLESQLTKLYDKQQSGKPLTPKQQQFVESNQQAYDQVVSSKTLNDQAAALQLMISGKTQGPAFQLQEEDKAGKEKSQERKDRLADTAFEGMERIQPEIADEAYDTQEPTKGTVKADINENEPLTEGVPRRSIRSYIGKKVNLLMADLLKVDLNNKTQKMGGAFFPLIPGLRGKVAWASIDIAAAKAIIRGAIKSQISMVYNMNPEAMMSNKVFLESVLDRISNLPDANIVFNQMMDRIQKLSYQKNTEKIHEVAKKSKTMAEFKQNFADLNVDQKAAIMKSILPEQGTDYSGSKIKVFRTLSNDGITKQSMLAENVEQFAADLPAGALTMALNIVDENGNRPTEDTIDNFIITRKQAIEMGLPIHDNYPIYIKGNVDAILTETAPFWDVIKDFKRSLDAKIANLIQKKDTYIVETEVTDKKGDKNKVDVAVKVYNNPNGTRTIEVFNSTEIKGEGKKTSIDALEKEDTDAFIKKNIGKIKSYDEGGLYTAKEARSSTMRSASMKADSAFEITEPTKSKYQQFVERLAKAFPSVEVVTSQEEFNAMIDEIRENKVGNKVLLTKSQNVYGAVYNGKLYLNPNLENYNTPIHEFGHIWLNVAKTMRADLYNKGLELVRNSEYLEQIKNSPEYSRIVKVMQAQGFSEQEIETYLEEEALATAIGDKGESFVSAATKRSFNNWLNNVFDFVKKMTGISDVTAAELQDMTLDDFVQGVVVDLMSENQQFKDAEIESFGSQLQLMTGPAGLSMQDIISMGRAYGFIDAAIKQTLMSQGFKVKDIDAAMQVQVNLVDTMPTAFANVAGGLNEGLTMFNEIQQELEDFRRGTTTTTRAPRMTAKERAARVAELRQQNPTLTELSDSELLKRFPRPAQAATTTTTRPTVGEVRAKALELLQAHPTFQAQTETVQMELMSAYDKTLKTRANNIIQRQISAIRNNLRQRKIGAKELQDAKAFLRNFIKTALPKSEIYSEKDINKMLQILAKSTEATIMRDTDNILAIVEQQREKMKTNVIKDMFAMIANKAKVGKTTGGKRRAAGLDAEGQAFFEAASAILKAVIKGNQTFLDAVKQELDAAENDGRMLSAIMKSVNNEKLTAKERDLLNKAHAYDTFINVKDMQLEEVQNLFAVMKGRRSQSIMDLASKRMQRAAEYEVLNAEASAQMRELNPVLFTEITDENGDVQVVPKNTAQLNKDKKEIYDFIRKGKIGKAIRAAKKNWNFNTMGSVRKFFANIFYHLGTMMNMFDNKAKGMTFFVDNVYRPLNRMDENSKLGYFQQMQVLNGIANSIQGITKGFKQLRDSLQTNEVYRIEMKRGDSQTGEFKNMFNKEQLMRMYALSKNATQRNILERQGLTDAKIDEIKNIIGPQAVEFVDKTVDYLSNEYYESVNDVYSAVNDVHLGRIENYFPTQRVDPNAPIDFNPDDPNFSGIFNAETAPSLYERTNSKADIDVDLDFFDVLDKHMQNMERYKAHAEGVKKINAIFQNKNVIAVLDASRTKALIKNLINYAITPNFGMSQQQTILGKIQNKFTGFALAFKVVQIIKQATSFVQAFEDYSYFSKNQNQSKAVRIAKLPIDLIGFMIDSAYVIATMPKQVKQAYGMSANLRDRISKGIEGDVYGLESGARFFKPVDKNSSAWGKTRRALKTGAAAPTMIGDVLGVMGYMVNYRRNIKNGMSQEDALEAFNDYNATQQTRRATERSSIQNNKYELVRAFTMFGSTAFLQMNKVAQAWKNMMDSLKTKGNRMPAAKDIRALILNLGVANAMFALASNLAKYALGDDDDKEEVKKKILEAAAGMNLIMSVPFFNEAFQNAKNYVEGTKDPTRLGTNPLMGVWWKTQKALKADDYTKAVIPLIELTLGAQLDPAIGLYNGFTEGFDDEAIYQTLGISKSYRPSAEDSDDEEDSDEGMMSKTDMKRYNPEMYERLYGKDGSMTEYEELLRKQRKVQAEARRREKDALYGFDENANPDKDDEFGGQNTFGEGFGSGSKFGSGSTFGGGQ